MIRIDQEKPFMQPYENEIENEIIEGIPYMYAPSWLLSGNLDSVAPSKTVSLFPYFQEQEQAILLLLLSDLQRQLLHPADPKLWEKEMLPLTLDTKRLLRSIPNRHPSEEVFFWRTVTTLGYLQLLLQETGAAPRTLFLFQSPTLQQCHGKHFEMTLLLPRENLPFLLGVHSGYSSFCSSASQPWRVAQSPSFIWKPIWLDFSHGEKKWYLHFLSNCQNPDSLLDMNGAHASGWSAFFSPSVTSRKKSFMTQWRSFQSFTRRLYEHGFLSPLEVDDSTYLPFSQKELQIYWQRPLSTFEEQGSRHFCRRVSYLETQRFLHRPTLLTQLGSGVPASHLNSLKDHVLSVFRTKGTKTLLSHFILLEAGVILPSVLLFLEWILRMHPDHTQPLVPAMRDWMQGCNVNALSEQPLACLESFQERLEDAPATWLNWMQEIPSFTIARLSVDTVISPVVETDEESVANSSVSIEKLDRIQTRAELEAMRSRSQTSYLQLYKTYLTSLDPKSRQLIATIKEQLKPKAFEEQITQRLVTYMVDHPHCWKS
jgi:hypothetical protein